MDPELLDGLTTLNDLLAALGDPSKILRVRASKAPIDFEAQQLGPADMIECDFDGYSPVKLAEFTPVLWDDATYAEVLSEDCRFEAGPAIVPQTIYALYLTIEEIGGAETVREVFVLQQPITMYLEKQTFTKRVRFIGVAPDA